MGQRANLLYIKNDTQRLFYCHWCANTLTRDLFWGPQHATQFTLQQREVGEDGWLDDIWAEGGAVLDADRQVLLLYGGEDVLYDIPLRRVYLALLRHAWPGWNVRWATRGIFDLAAYAGIPEQRVRARRQHVEDLSRITLDPPRERDWVDTVASLIFEDGSLKLFPLSASDEFYLALGPNLVELARGAAGLEQLPLDQWTSEFPHAGFHIDVRARQLSWWMADPVDANEQIAARWTGWEVRWLQDRYEAQLEATRGQLRLPERSPLELADAVEAMLMYTTSSGGPALIRQIVDEKEQQGHEVTVNPYALRDDPLDLAPVARRHLLDQIRAAWEQDQQL